GVAQRQQNLSGRDVMPRERFGPSARERDLSNGGGGLRILKLERTARQLEHGATERDRTRRHHQNLALVRVEVRNVLGERGEPILMYAASRGIDQQR